MCERATRLRCCGNSQTKLQWRPNSIRATSCEEIKKRESLGSTGVGNGVALPHARLAGLKAPFALLARLRNAIDFEAIDDEPVDIVVLLLLPETANGEQLNALACVARALRSPETLKQIREAADQDAAFRAIAASRAADLAAGPS